MAQEIRSSIAVLNLWRGRRLFSVILLAIAAAAGPLPITPQYAAAATAVPFGPDLAANGWRLMTFPRRTPTRFTARGLDMLSINAERAVAVLWRAKRPAERSPVAAQWRWRVDSRVGPTDLARKGGDDRAIAVYFVFSDNAGVSEMRDLGSALRSGNTKILMYVWGGIASKERFLPAPYLGENARTIILRSASDPIGNWRTERVDLDADYRAAFGMATPALVGLAISSDSDDTNGTNVALISDLVVNP